MSAASLTPPRLIGGDKMWRPAVRAGRGSRVQTVLTGHPFLCYLSLAVKQSVKWKECEVFPGSDRRERVCVHVCVCVCRCRGGLKRLVGLCPPKALRCTIPAHKGGLVQASTSIHSLTLDFSFQLLHSAPFHPPILSIFTLARIPAARQLTEPAKKGEEKDYYINLN